jgi:hypothetical protein
MNARTLSRTTAGATIAVAALLLAVPVVSASHGQQTNALGTAWINGRLFAELLYCTPANDCVYWYGCEITGGGNNLGGIIGCKDFTGTVLGYGFYDGGLTGDKSYSFVDADHYDWCKRGHLESSNLDWTAFNRPHYEGAMDDIAGTQVGYAVKALHDFHFVCGVSKAYGSY